MFFCFVFWAQLVSSDLLFSILQKMFFGNAVQKIRFFDIVSKKHYKNRLFLERVAFPIASKNLFY